MTKALMTRVRRLEAVQSPYSKPRIIYVRDDLPPDQAEALRSEIRKAVDHPNLFLVVYHSPDGSDSLSRLMGAEAGAINQRHREIALQRSYGHE